MKVLFKQSVIYNLLKVSAIILVLSSCAEDKKRKLIEADPDYAGVKFEDIPRIRKEINADAKIAQIEAVIKKKVELEGFNGNVLIAQKGIVLYKKSFGYANFETKDTLTGNSKFQLASLSKTFTAIGTMMLVQEGKISLENTVKDVFTDFPYEGITIRSLLSHRSGLPNYQYAFDVQSRKDTTGLNNSKMMQWFALYKPALYNKPDHYFGYNNSNYAVLAAIIEKIAGMPFEKYAREKIFLPLGMKDTFVVTTADSTINQYRTTGYDGTRKIEKDVLDDVSGDKGVYSTTSDLYKWYRGLTSNKLISAELMHEVIQPRSFEFPGFRNYGFGFRLWLDAQLQTEYVYHTGWWKGYHSIMWYSPKSEYVIIMVANRLNRTIFNLKPIVDILNEGTSTLEDDITDGGSNGGGSGEASGKKK